MNVWVCIVHVGWDTVSRRIRSDVACRGKMLPMRSDNLEPSIELEYGGGAV